MKYLVKYSMKWQGASMNPEDTIPTVEAKLTDEQMEEVSGGTLYTSVTPILRW
jgi:hypothetical protein